MLGKRVLQTGLSMGTGMNGSSACSTNWLEHGAIKRVLQTGLSMGTVAMAAQCPMIRRGGMSKSSGDIDGGCWSLASHRPVSNQCPANGQTSCL